MYIESRAWRRVRHTVSTYSRVISTATSLQSPHVLCTARVPRTSTTSDHRSKSVETTLYTRSWRPRTCVSKTRCRVCLPDSVTLTQRWYSELANDTTSDTRSSTEWTCIYCIYNVHRVLAINYCAIQIFLVVVVVLVEVIVLLQLCSYYSNYYYNCYYYK